ncbi:sugar ABC transporter substrate-binding protein [Microbacterium sp. P01]|uniref:sugar ABC transporter substrate-binding protein n=1 Tax=unclassified Microbacterium TaxID=2609290 RepID=UPI00366B1382
MITPRTTIPQRTGSRSFLRRTVAVAVMAGALTTGLLACSPAGTTDGKIALLLPDVKTARYETFDRPIFTAKVEQLGDYDVLYSNADQDAAKQQQQAESALANGAGVIVLDPVDAKAAVSIVTEANSRGVPVISYDRLVAGGDIAYYISFDNEKVGMLQAEELSAALAARGEERGEILMVNGSPTDANAALFSEGARAVLDGTELTVLGEFSTPDWSPDKAQEWVAGQIAQYRDRISAVYAANDGTAGGAIAALKAANVDPLPLVTGQDAELSAIQRILTGDQFMTVYKAIRQQAENAAEAAVTLLGGGEIDAATQVDGIPATLLEPVAVTIDNISDTVIADGFWTADDICTPDYAAACTAAGIE